MAWPDEHSLMLPGSPGLLGIRGARRICAPCCDGGLTLHQPRSYHVFQRRVARRCSNTPDRGANLVSQADAMVLSQIRGPLPMLATGFL